MRVSAGSIASEDGGRTSGDGGRADPRPPEALMRCLDALERQTVDDFEIVVVDDRSRSTGEAVAPWWNAPHARIVAGEGRGPAAARNLGVQAAHGEIVCFTDDDCRPGDGWLATLERASSAAAEVVAGPTLGDRRRACVRASQLVTNHLVDESREPSGAIGFAPTSNIACRRASMTLPRSTRRSPPRRARIAPGATGCGGSATGSSSSAEAWVLHEPALTVAALWRQHTRYGAGAYRYLGARATGEPAASRRRFYVRLFATRVRRWGGRRACS